MSKGLYWVLFMFTVEPDLSHAEADIPGEISVIHREQSNCHKRRIKWEELNLKGKPGETLVYACIPRILKVVKVGDKWFFTNGREALVQ